MVDGMRQRERAGAKPVSRAALLSLMDSLPPRVTSRFRVGASNGSEGIESIYIETFIRPDELNGRPGKSVLQKVEQAIAVASKEGAQVATLGGFTSIFVEAGAKIPADAPALTSGNTLTAALIVRGIERALSGLGRNLSTEDVLVIGASGDIGSGVSRWLAGRCRSLTLAARNRQRLERERAILSGEGRVEIAYDVAAALSQATLVVAAASTTDNPFPLDKCRPGTLLCDAGYPKNLAARVPQGVHLFHGGMGEISGGLPSHDGMLEQFYRFPQQGIAHGCMLEGAVLALAGRYEPFSQGRGRITPQRIDEIWALASTHGVSPAPLFNDAGLWLAERCM
ncbi:hypothetical protein GRI42_00095 [Erythrobacter gaetbuli]|uniref:Quinate/shikimate 5-dehydrogenase/glutamyl-tRNA reductase domain-containing protein n=1 Tax=Qipengyuania gaetbuli TaxID=266952 RepID=A0A844XVY0_9SPHN|nr:hypothetical protein [Qipengyuania gaetbuli]MXO49704.1 hypothetical protein [Qipengyuania gaetbuli]